MNSDKVFEKFQKYDLLMISEADNLVIGFPLTKEAIQDYAEGYTRELTQEEIKASLNGNDQQKAFLILDKRFHPTSAQVDEFLSSGSRLLALALAKKSDINLTSEQANSLLSNFGEYVKCTAIKNKSIKLTPEQAERCLNDDNPIATINLVERGDIDFTSYQKDKLLSDPLYLVRRAAAEHINDFTYAQIDKIVNDPESFIREHSLRFIEDLNPDQVYKLASDPDSYIRKSLALSIKNPSPEIIDKLANDPNPEVRLAAKSLEKNSTSESVNKFGYDHNNEVAKIWKTSEHVTYTPEPADISLSDRDIVRRVWGQEKSWDPLSYTPSTSQLDRWIELSDDRVIAKLLQNPEVRFTKRQVRNLLSTDSVDVLRSIFENPDYNKYVEPSHLKEILKKKTDPELRELVNQKLQNMAENSPAAPALRT